MKNPLPLILMGGGALLVMSSKKKSKQKKSTNSEDSSSPARKLPSITDEDMDQNDADLEPDTVPVKPKPIPVEPDLEPDAEPDLEPDPDVPSSKPPIGPTGAGTCVNEIYNRDPEYITPDITISNQALVAFKESDYYLYLRLPFQTKLYNYMYQRFMAMKNNQERRTVASVILREALKHFNSGCKWEGPIDLLGKAEQLVWDSGHRLAVMAQITVGIHDPIFNELFHTGKRYSITRTSLGETDPGFYGAQKKPAIGNRIEILVTDDTQENAEHIIGQVTKLTGPNGEPDQFEVKIIDKFQGANVSPQLKSKHGFKVGSNAYFSQKGPTGIYRIFPEGKV